MAKKKKDVRTVKVSTSSPKETPVTSSAKTTSATIPQTTLEEMPFGRMNYILLGIGVLVIALGFFLMSRDPFIDATQFSVSLHIAPVIVVAGFVEVVFAIMYQPKSSKE